MSDNAPNWNEMSSNSNIPDSTEFKLSESYMFAPEDLIGHGQGYRSKLIKRVLGALTNLADSSPYDHTVTHISNSTETLSACDTFILNIRDRNAVTVSVEVDDLSRDESSHFLESDGIDHNGYFNKTLREAVIFKGGENLWLEKVRCTVSILNDLYSLLSMYPFKVIAELGDVITAYALLTDGKLVKIQAPL